MKATIRVALYIALVAMVPMINSCSTERQLPKPGDQVYVCSGPKAKRYHSDSGCKGLSRCSGEILEMSIKDAEEEGRTPCMLCH